MGRILFLCAALLGLGVGAWLLRQVVITRRVGRRYGGPEGFMAEAQWHSEVVRLAQQIAYLLVALNSFLGNGPAALTAVQLRGVVLIIVGQVLLTINSYIGLRARHKFRDRFGASTLSLQEQLVALRWERDQLRARLAAATKQEGEA